MSDMEITSKNKFTLSVDKLKNCKVNSENEFKSSGICGYSNNEVSESVSDPIQRSKYFEDINVINEDSQENKIKSSKIPSVLDPYCKTNVLDESDDFIHCESMNKFKNSKNESASKSNKREIVSCEICKEDITHLDVHNRAIHVNNCIDKQIAVPPEQTSETENTFILECPLCFKHFPSPELRTNHIKKCGKSKGLSLQSIIKALELQERHALERISLGLPAMPIKPVKSHKNTISKRAAVEPKNKVQSDIQLAKALSLSLADANKQNEDENNANIMFVTLKPPTTNQHPGKKSKKVVSTPVLVLRTEEERKKLLLNRVATIVAPQVSCEDDSPVDIENGSTEKENKNPCELPFLWQLSGKALEKHEYYVENLLEWIQPSDVEVGAKLCHLSQIAGHEIVTQVPLDYTFGSQEAEKENCVDSSISTPSSLIGSLRCLVASSWMSDVDIYTACGTVIPAHRLLLAVRCPPLKQNPDFCSKNGRVSLQWESTPFDVALQFLNFIYTGNTEIEENMKSDLLYLANKYEVSDLQALLLTNKRMDILSEIESNEKVSEEIAGNGVSSPPPSQIQTPEHEKSTHYETQEDTNMDLEIVYNCINSSMKPSQMYMDEPLSSSQAASLQLESITKTGCSSDLYFNGSVSLADCSKQSTTSDCAVSAHISPTSPVIFDVDDSESDNEMDVNSDNESIELPVNCSQKSVLQECNLDKKELDLCSTESNSSQDSVKFLESSFPAHYSLSQTPVKEKNSFVFTSPKFSMNHIGEESPSVVNNVSRDSQDDPKSCKQKDAFGSRGFHSDDNVTLESPILSHLKILSSQDRGKFQINNEINENEISSVDPSDKNSVIYQVYEQDNIHHSSSISTSLRPFHEEFARDYGSSVINMKGFSANEGNLLSSPENSVCEEKASPLRSASSPEVLICDSDSDLKSPMSISCERFALNHEENDVSQSQIKSSFHSIGLAEKISMDFQDRKDFLENPPENEDSFIFQSSATTNNQSNFISGVSLERRSSTSPGVLCPTSGEDNISSPVKYSFLDKEKCELKDKFSFSDVPSEMIGSCKLKGSSRSPQTPANPFDDPQYECYEYFELDALSPPKPKTVELHSSQNSKFTKDNHVTKSVTPKSCTQPQFQVTESPITPLPDYKNMVTPEIKQALRKIGVKALPRKKAVALLSHIYNETHPLIDGEINTESCSSETTSKTEQLKKRKKPNENVAKRAKKQQTIVQCPEANSATQDSDDSSSENPEWQGCVPEISFSQCTQDSPTKATKDDIDLIKQYIQSNEELYNNILTYLPLNLIAFHQELKDNGIKISIQKLMDFLDEQCITFTCPRKEEYRKKQTARSQRFRKNMIAKFSQQTS